MPPRLKPGDLVVYHKSKRSARPGPRARGVRPACRGEDYAYYVDKFWLVVAVDRKGTIVAETRRGKRHRLRPSDPALRRARWWERLLKRQRFPKPR